MRTNIHTARGDRNVLSQADPIRFSVAFKSSEHTRCGRQDKLSVSVIADQSMTCPIWQES